MNITNLYIFEFINNNINFEYIKNITKLIRNQFKNNIIIFLFDKKLNISSKIKSLCDEVYYSNKNNKLFSIFNDIYFIYDKLIHILLPSEVNYKNIFSITNNKLDSDLIISNDKLNLLVHIYDYNKLNDISHIIKYISYKNITKFLNFTVNNNLILKDIQYNILSHHILILKIN